MGRHEQPIDPGAGLIAEFALGLRALRDAADRSYDSLACRTGLAKSTLSSAANGRRLPTWKVARAYVHACNGDVVEWEARWLRAREWARSNRSAARAGGLAATSATVKPDPNNIRTPADFVAGLYQLRAWGGAPSLRQMSERTEIFGRKIPQNTIAYRLRSTGLPRWQMVAPLLFACGESSSQTLKRWLVAWIRVEQGTSADPIPEDLAESVVLSAGMADDLTRMSALMTPTSVRQPHVPSTLADDGGRLHAPLDLPGQTTGRPSGKPRVRTPAVAAGDMTGLTRSVDQDRPVTKGANLSDTAFLATGLRLLADLLRKNDQLIPYLYAARTSADDLELLLAVPRVSAPAPIVAENNGSRWVLPRITPLPDLDDDPSPLPGFVPVGRDKHGVIFLDLEAAAGLISIGGEPERTQSFVKAIAQELINRPADDGVNVVMVGFGVSRELPPNARLRHVATVGQLLQEADRRQVGAGTQLFATGPDSVLTGRVRRPRDPFRPPEVVLVATPPQPGESAGLKAWMSAGRDAPMAVVIAGTTPGARWQLVLDRNDRLSGEVLGLSGIQARLLPKDAHLRLDAAVVPSTGSVGDLPYGHDASVSSGYIPEQGRFDESVGHSADRLTVNPGEAQVADYSDWPAGNLPMRMMRRHLDPSIGRILVQLFGEPAVVEVGTQRSILTGGLVEVIAYIALHGRVSRAAMATALWPRLGQDEQETILHSLQNWLGRAADGGPRLRLTAETADLSDEVQVDWHLFQVMTEGNQPDNMLRALELIRGGLASPRPRGRYGWLPQQLLDHLADLVVTTAHAWAEICHSTDSLDAALASCRTGLLVSPLAEPLIRLQMELSRERRVSAELERELAPRPRRLVRILSLGGRTRSKSTTTAPL